MIQLIGFMLSALGQFLISAATAMDMWSLQDRSLTVVTNVYTYSGLWNSCVGTAYGTTQCRPYFTILGLPGKRITFTGKKSDLSNISPCWIKENIFQKTLEGTLEYLEFLGQIFSTSSLHKNAVDCRKHGVSLESNGNLMKHPKLS